MAETFREASRLEWVNSQTGKPTDTQIATGALQRIADATEAMAKNHIALMADRDRYLRFYTQQKEKSDRLERSNAALRGHIKRLKATA